MTYSFIKLIALRRGVYGILPWYSPKALVKLSYVYCTRVTYPHVHQPLLMHPKYQMMEQKFGLIPKRTRSLDE